MELRKIPVADIYPDEKNPRNDFGDVNALAASFELNSLNPGEPVNPPVVVQDGGIYRIVDGERRYKGIKHNKLTSCHVIVCDDMDEANSMVAMLATDDKQQLSDIERSRGVQQMLLLGVDPIKVERTARLAKGDAARVRQAMDKVDDAAEDMTLDRMLAIAEFADDAKTVDLLTNAQGNEWKWMARQARDKKEALLKYEAMVEALNDVGVPLVSNTDDMHFCGGLSSDQISSYDYPEGAVANFSSEGSTTAWIYAPATTYASSAEAAAVRERNEERKRRHEATEESKEAHKNRITWLVENIKTAQYTKELISIWISDRKTYDLYEKFSANGFNESYGTDIKPEITPYTLSLMVDAIPCNSHWFIAAVTTGEKEVDADNFIDDCTAALLSTMHLDGYAIADIEQKYLDAFNAAAQNKTEQEEQCQ